MSEFDCALSSSVRVIIPMLNASRYLDYLLPALSAQSGLVPDQVLVLDSTSDDDTAVRCRDWGAEVLSIERAEFDHGGTRKRGAAHCAQSEILIFLTQDAIPAQPHALSRLAAVFHAPEVAIAYGRQLPRPEACAIERHARLYNYPPEGEVRTLADTQRLGMKTCFCSNSFAAYRHSALQAVGSFPDRAFFAEDQIMAGRLLKAGHSLAYVANAEVIHSHEYNLRQEFGRYFDVGVFHSRNKWLLQTFGRAESAGFQFVYSEIMYLSKIAPWRIPETLLRTVIKYIGYRLGAKELKLSDSTKARLSMQSYYWKR